ncbi:hypothetical protein [Terasakiella sp.]|uniref:hypothetical protein n=1 Tax=Terasakiella sp. TaxID=2034861 RepID=UPI003AA8A853
MNKRDIKINASEWLSEHDWEDIVVVLGRSALRFVPEFLKLFDRASKEEIESVILLYFRNLSVSFLEAVTSDADRAPNYISREHIERHVSLINALNDQEEARNILSLSYDVTNMCYIKNSPLRAFSLPIKFREEIEDDISFLRKGMGLLELLNQKLWLNSINLNTLLLWPEIVKKLLFLDSHWSVWINWYEDRLNGKPFNWHFERERALIPEEDWEKGAAHVNALIAEMEKRYQVPEPEDLKQRPSVVETEVREDGKLHRKNDENEITDADLQESLQEAWEAHKDHFEDLKSLNPGQNEPTLQRVLSAYEKALGTNYADLKIIALGVHGQRLQELALRADDRFLENVASELSALAAAHALFIQQFPKWRRYHVNSEPDPSGEQLDAALKFAKEIKDYDDIIDEDVIEPTLDLVEDVEESLFADPDTKPLLSKELLNVNANILAGLMRPCLKYVRDCAGAVRKGSLNGVEKGSEELVRRTISLGGLALVLSQIAPDKFGWVKLVLDALKNAMK